MNSILRGNFTNSPNPNFQREILTNRQEDLVILALQ